MPSNFKKLVRARMAKTGESYQTAARAVRAQAPKKKVKTETMTIYDALQEVALLAEEMESNIEEACFKCEERYQDDTERYDQLIEAQEAICELSLEQLPMLIEDNASVSNDTIEVPEDWENKKSLKTMAKSAIKLLELLHSYLKLLLERELFEDTDGVVSEVAGAIEKLKAITWPRLKVAA